MYTIPQMEKTKVKFMYHEVHDDLFAYFPETKTTVAEIKGSVFDCYTHVGQHSHVVQGYIDECREATFEEREALHRELVSIGYDVVDLNDKFNDIESLPKNVQEAISEAGECDTYEALGELVRKLQHLGYTFDYYLDATPYNLRKL